MIRRREMMRCMSAAPLILTNAGFNRDALFPGGKRFAVTFSIDDGFWKSAQEFLPLFDRFNYRATFNLVTSWITPMRSGVGDDYNQASSHGTWTNWKTVLDRGHEIGSHSMTHPHLPQLDESEVKRQLLYSKRRITKRLTLWGRKTFAFPYNDSSPAVREMAGRYYLAAREGTRTGEINQPGAIDFLGVRSWWPLQHNTLGDIVEKIDETRDMRGWLVIGLHGMNGEGWHPITTEKMTGVLDYLSKQNDVYVDTFKNTALWLMKKT
ncbi:MAG: polysaccharide deacetylase family protein [Candidatus Omnitrophica bacterium]|nr:polysaccharide deacetylase family protein [Candidatus Omnitrophota bacterium]